MGTFGGHVLPGSFFIIFSIWWLINIFHRYYQGVYQTKKPFVSTATYRCCCLCGRLRHWEIEGLVKIIFTTTGFVLEIITAMKDGQFYYMGNGQHATMFFMFGLSGVIDILVHQGVALPRGVEYVAMIVAFCSEGLLFKFHLFGRDELDVLIHTLLLYVILGTVVLLTAELCIRDQVIIALGKSVLVLVQGTWFWQIAFILYNPLPSAGAWLPDNKDHLLLAAMMFVWHLAAVFIIALSIGFAVASYHRRQADKRCEEDGEDDGLRMNLIKPGHNGPGILRMVDSESDVEFEQTN